MKPIPAPGCEVSHTCRSDVTGEDLRYNVQEYLVGSPSGLSVVAPSWAYLSLALAQAAAGNATILSTPLATSETAQQFPGFAIGCQDWTRDASKLDDLLFKQRMSAVLAPHTRGASLSYSFQAGCIGWPAPVTNPQRKLYDRVRNAPEMLLVQSYWDPETSYVWATGLKSQIPTARLLTRNGSGHSSYLLFGETSKAIDRFLITGELPEDGAILDT